MLLAQSRRSREKKANALTLCFLLLCEIVQQEIYQDGVHLSRGCRMLFRNFSSDQLDGPGSPHVSAFLCLDMDPDRGYKASTVCTSGSSVWKVPRTRCCILATALPTCGQRQWISGLESRVEGAGCIRVRRASEAFAVRGSLFRSHQYDTFAAYNTKSSRRQGCFSPCRTYQRTWSTSRCRQMHRIPCHAKPPTDLRRRFARA